MPMQGESTAFASVGLTNDADVLLIANLILYIAPLKKLTKTTMIALATKVLKDYSKMLANIEPSNPGFAESFLPHSKTAIREATKSALSHLGAGQPAIREALIRGYVYLEQFVPDEQALVLMQAATPGDEVNEDNDTDAAIIISEIKERMARALEEISAFGATLGEHDLKCLHS
jgi:hypothetical protein